MKALMACMVAGSIGLAGTAAQARDGNVAAGIIGGLAVGTLLGVTAAQPRYVAPPPAYIVEEPEPVVVAPRCYWTRGEPVWDGYRGVWIRPRLRVCD